ncbi:MAG: nucleotide exchange factor GrpE [Thermoleophilia bacterium]
MTDSEQSERREEQTSGPIIETVEESAASSDVSGGDAGDSPELDEVARVTAERDDYLDHLLRLQAEFDNYRKRVQRDNEELRLRASEAVVGSLLPVLDNLGRALQAADQHAEGQLIAGVRLVAEQLQGALVGHGLDEIDVQPGAEFDPAVHEAVVTQAVEGQEEGTVLQVLEQGYLLHGRLLRPAKVIVAR